MPPHAPLYFEDCLPGRSVRAGPRRITRADIDAFTELSGDRTALHRDDAYAASTPFGGVVAHGALNLAAATGLAFETGAFEGTVLAVLSMEVRFDRPVRPDDAVSLTLTCREIDARPKPDRGAVAFSVALENQHGKTVLSGTWKLLLRRRSETEQPTAPS